MRQSEYFSEDSLKAYRDIKNSLDTAKEEGRAEGRAEGREEGIEAGRAEGIAMVAKTIYAKGMDIETIASMTGMDKNELEKLLG